VLAVVFLYIVNMYAVNAVSVDGRYVAISLKMLYVIGDLVLRFFILAVFLFISCADGERDNPYDPESKNYVPWSSSSSEPSSSSLAVAFSSSSSDVFVVPSSSSIVLNSSSSTPPSSSSAPTQSSIIRGTPVDYEDESYETVVIDTQTWMARNLNYDAHGSKCNDCATYGRLYDWATAMNLSSSCNSSTCASQVGAKHQGICPSGWHIPSDVDWNKLITAVGDSYTSGKYLKATSGWNSNGNGQDAHGFAALPGGYGTSGGSLRYVGISGRWWSATEFDANYVYVLGMYSYREDVDMDYSSKDILQSVRCLQD